MREVGGKGDTDHVYLQIVVHIPSFRHRRPQRQVLQRRVHRPRGVSRGAWPQAGRQRAGDDRRQADRALSKAFKRNMNVRVLSVERLINATIKQVDQLAGSTGNTVNKLATKLLREHGPINWPNSQTTRVQMHWHISQVPTWPAPPPSPCLIMSYSVVTVVKW